MAHGFSGKMGGMTYNDYHARIEYDSRDRIFVGHLVGIDAIVGFHGATADELERAFQESVGDGSNLCFGMNTRCEFRFTSLGPARSHADSGNVGFTQNTGLTHYRIRGRLH